MILIITKTNELYVCTVKPFVLNNKKTYESETKENCIKLALDDLKELDVDLSDYRIRDDTNEEKAYTIKEEDETTEKEIKEVVTE